MRQEQAIYEQVDRAFSRRAQIALLIAELGSLVEIAAIEMDTIEGALTLDYELMGAMVSVGIRLEQLEHTLLRGPDRVKIRLIRRARLLRMGQLASDPLHY